MQHVPSTTTDERLRLLVAVLGAEVASSRERVEELRAEVADLTAALEEAADEVRAWRRRTAAAPPRTVGA